MVGCAGDSGAPGHRTATNTVSAQHPQGIFDTANWCGGAGGDPPGDAAFMRIVEHESAGNAGQGAYQQIIFETPNYVHFKAAGGYTREPNAFNDGWRARFWGLDYANQWVSLLYQGSGVSNSGTDSPTSAIFGPHLWPFGSYLDFHHFFFELLCVRAGGCDRSNYNAVDANGFVFILNDDENSKVEFLNTGSPLLAGQWVRSLQQLDWNASDNGSGLRFERVRVDGSDRYVIDYQAAGMCNATASQTNGEFARVYQPCLTGGPYQRTWWLETANLADGAHNLSICTQDYGQYRGLNGTGNETCVSRPINVDNHAPGAPAGLQIVSPNPARYLDRFGAQFSLPPDPGSPIAKVHYQVINAAGDVVKPEKVLSGTNPTQIAEISGPEKAGDYRLRVWLEDSVGLSGPASTVQIPRDTTPPAAPQDISVTAPIMARTTQAFDVRWRDIGDAGSPIAAVHYEIRDAGGGVVVPVHTVSGETPQAIRDLDAPRERGAYMLRLWLSDAEGNVGAPASAPLAYECPRSEVGGGLTLSAGMGEGAEASSEVRQGQGSSLSGTLQGAGGAVAGAAVCVFANVITDQNPQFLGIAMTGTSGVYRFALPAGPSREVIARYRPDQRQLEAKATLLTRVRPTLSITPRVVRNGHVACFAGEIPGPHNDHVVVVMQVKSGKGWRAFRRYRTHEGGEFEVCYRFTQTTGETTYKTRAQIRAQAAYPYLQGNSQTRPVRVRP